MTKHDHIHLLIKTFDDFYQHFSFIVNFILTDFSHLTETKNVIKHEKIIEFNFYKETMSSSQKKQ